MNDSWFKSARRLEKRFPPEGDVKASLKNTRRFYILLFTAAFVMITSAMAPVNADTASANTQQWRFIVTLDDRDIGFHTFSVRQQAAEKTVAIEAQFDVKFLFFNAYKYRHNTLESWTDGCLRSIQSSTDDNGDVYELEGTGGQGDFELSRNDESANIDRACIQTFAYWDSRLLQSGQLLNAQTGELKWVQFEKLGPEPFPFTNRTLASERVRLSMDDREITLWYEQGSGLWLGLETTTEGGRVLRYLPDQLPDLPLEAQFEKNMPSVAASIPD